MRTHFVISFIMFVGLGLSSIDQQVLAAEQCVSLFETHSESRITYPERVLKNMFMTARRLFVNSKDSPSYAGAFGDSFIDRIFGFTSQHIWFDGGVGNGNHVVDYFQEGGNGSVIGAALTETPIHELNVQLMPKGKYKHYHGRGLEEISTSEIPLVDAATDYFGAGTYTKHLSEVLRFYFSILKPGAPFYWMVPTSYKKIKIFDENGHYMPLETFLKRIPGIHVVPKRGFFGRSDFQFFTITVDKSFNPDWIPQLENTLYEFSDFRGDPKREFRMVRRVSQ